MRYLVHRRPHDEPRHSSLPRQARDGDTAFAYLTLSCRADDELVALVQAMPGHFSNRHVDGLTAYYCIVGGVEFVAQRREGVSAVAHV